VSRRSNLYPPLHSTPTPGWPEIVGAFLGVIIVVALNLALLAGAVWVVVSVLRHMGVI